MLSVGANAVLQASGCCRSRLAAAALTGLIHAKAGVGGPACERVSLSAVRFASTASKPNNGLYPGHINTSTLQKGLLAVGSAISALIDPTRYRNPLVRTVSALITPHVT